MSTEVHRWDPTLADVQRIMQETGGGWISCSGCYTTEDGQPVGEYPFSPALGCFVGGGCYECGGLGARWHFYSKAEIEAEVADAAPSRYMRLPDELQSLYQKLIAAPLGMDEAWRVDGERGKPLLYGRSSLLAYGTIGTWDEFYLIAALVNALRGVIPAAHPDDLAVDRCAGFMKRKLGIKRRQGRGGWSDKADCSNEQLSAMLREHVEKGDPLDVMNFAMMIHQRDERIASAPARELQPGEAWQELCETPDVTSPEEYPDHALITAQQLADFMRRAAGLDRLLIIEAAAETYVAAVHGQPEKDCWDTEDGKPAEGAERFASDWSWQEYDARKQAAFDDLRAALSGRSGA